MYIIIIYSKYTNYLISNHVIQSGKGIRYSNFLSVCVFSFRVTFCHLPFQSKWLYVGTERGNIHIVNVESFTLSGYVIMWNKAIEL